VRKWKQDWTHIDATRSWTDSQASLNVLQASQMTWSSPSGVDADAKGAGKGTGGHKISTDHCMIIFYSCSVQRTHRRPWRVRLMRPSGYTMM
jgi:hypothetical protein